MPKRTRRSQPSRPVTLRIVGGTLRGRTIRHVPAPGTRPMKDRVREAVFNLLGPAVRDALAVDLFAGTGALAFEALSRGATAAVAVERHFPGARAIQQNALSLGVATRLQVVARDTFVWWSQTDLDARRPWVVFCAPPYDYYETRSPQMLELIGSLVATCPPSSLIMVESDNRLDCSLLPRAARWQVRRYPPAVIAIYRASDARLE